MPPTSAHAVESQSKPYCECNRGPKDGFTQDEDGNWVHATCMKPTKFVYEKIVLPKMLVGGHKFDEIIRRKRVFMDRVAERTERELTVIAEELSADVRLVKMIWEQND